MAGTLERNHRGFRDQGRERQATREMEMTQRVRATCLLVGEPQVTVVLGTAGGIKDQLYVHSFMETLRSE
jgi:hypothetical protein